MLIYVQIFVGENKLYIYVLGSVYNAKATVYLATTNTPSPQTENNG
jgi:hypothetical protein